MEAVKVRDYKQKEQVQAVERDWRVQRSWAAYLVLILFVTDTGIFKELI